SIVQDIQGNMWIGTYGGGLNKLDPRTNKITRFQHDNNNPGSISSNAGWSIAADHSGKLWLGTFGGGINVFNPDNTITHIVNNPKDPGSIIDNNIIRIYIDKEDNIWVGSTKGLSKYDRQKKEFKNYREQDGLPNESVFGILEDDEGNLWISTNKGLSRFNPQKNVFKNYYSQDGLQGNEFNQNAFAKDGITGQLMFGGPNGFNVFNPIKVNVNNYLPPVVFTDYLRYNTDNTGGKPIYEKGISSRDSLLLTYKENIINLQFSGMSYYNTFQNQYRYKLEGFNKNWIQLENNNSVTFTNLSPGEYKLRVIASNNDGLWNYKGASLFIKVTPPWWKTNIAYSFYIIFFAGFLYVVRRSELNRREQKARIRENELQLKAT
ncbi:MAG: triple tyrosine motif-containing protein, partial [Ignavibacteriaceae bacterium]|nr:triple tyrosine motif-containing protein [Ignavibacteriaceae bacterium]